MMCKPSESVKLSGIPGMTIEQVWLEAQSAYRETQMTPQQLAEALRVAKQNAMAILKMKRDSDEWAEKRESELAERVKQLEDRWVCFHCGFQTTDHFQAAAHFGDRDDPEETKPICRWWKSMTPEERGEQLQDMILELNAERDDNAALCTKIEGLEHRVEGQLSEIHSFKPFRSCSSIQEIFNIFDSMEGQALLAAERVKVLEAAEARMVLVNRGLRRRVHMLERHNQHFERCESAWCNPSLPQGDRPVDLYSSDPAYMVGREEKWPLPEPSAEIMNDAARAALSSTGSAIPKDEEGRLNGLQSNF